MSTITPERGYTLGMTLISIITMIGVWVGITNLQLLHLFSFPWGEILGTVLGGLAGMGVGYLVWDRFFWSRVA